MRIPNYFFINTFFCPVSTSAGDTIDRRVFEPYLFSSQSYNQSVTECAEKGCVLQCSFDGVRYRGCECHNGSKITTGELPRRNFHYHLVGNRDDMYVL